MKTIENLKFYKKELIIGPIFKLFEAIIEVTLPFLMAKLINNIGTWNSKEIIYYGIGMLFLTIIAVFFASFSQYMAAKASQGYGTKMRNDIYMQLLKLDQKQIEKFNSSFLINTVTNDTFQLETAIAMFIRLVIRVPFIVICALAMVYIINKKYALILFGATILLGICIFLIVRCASPLYQKFKKKLDILTNIIKENLINVRVVRGFIQEKQEINKFKEVNEQTKKYSELSSIISNLLNPITTIILNITIVFVIYFASSQIQSGSLEKGELIAVINYISQMLLAIVVLANLITIYTRAYTSFLRVNKIMKAESKLKSGPICRINENAIAIKVQNLNFSYYDENVLENINLEIKTGEIIGIIGLTGAGKSTLLNLICRNYDIDSGKIILFGQDIKKYNLEYLKKEIVFLSQKPGFFHDTIKNNILLGREDIKDEEILNAIKKSDAIEFVEKLPNKMDNYLEKDANNLSGGQKQRIAIARAFITKPKVLLLDDITSALDRKTEKIVLNNIIQYAKENKITVLMATQKISTLKYADKIIVLKDGKIESFEESKKINNISKTYQEIYNMQNS